MAADLFFVDEIVPVLARPTGTPGYDFDFRSFLPCRHPFGVESVSGVVARLGAWPDYAAAFDELRAEGVTLVHDPATHLRASTLPGWYDRIAELTPKSVCFDAPPAADVVERALGWPVFIKGARQTSRHRRATSVATSAADFARAMALWSADPVLAWQPVVCRELVRLRPVEDADPERLPSCFEFRLFFWRGELVGAGRYWWQGAAYGWTDAERRAAERLATEAARRVDVPFLVVDVAQAADGRWLVIECNDGQESGYAGVSPFGLWQRVIELERARAVG